MIQTASPPIPADLDFECEAMLLSLLDLEFGTVDIDAETDLLEDGHLDSLAVLEFVLLIEESYSLEIADEDVIPDHFRTVRAMAGLLSRLRS